METMETWLVTGAGGFIGRVLCLKLKELGIKALPWPTTQMREFARGEMPEIVRSKIGELSHFEPSSKKYPPFLQNQLGPDDVLKGVVHLAARVHRKAAKSPQVLDEYLFDNCQIPVSIAQFCQQQQIPHLIFASSVKALPPQSWDTKIPVQELIYQHEQWSAAQIQLDPYGYSKWLAEQKLQQLTQSNSNTRISALRFPLLYGPGNKGNMLTLLKLARLGLPVPLSDPGKKFGRRSFLFLDNAVSAILRTMNYEPKLNNIFNSFTITDNEDLSSAELYEILLLKMQKPNLTFPLPLGSLKKCVGLAHHLQEKYHLNLSVLENLYSRLIQEQQFSCTEFMHHYNWTPPTSVASGLQKTVAWFLSS